MVNSLYLLILDSYMAVWLLEQVKLSRCLQDLIVVANRVYQDAEPLDVILVVFGQHNDLNLLALLNEVIDWRDIVNLLVNEHMELLSGHLG